MELRDLLLCNYDCEVTIKPSTGTPYTWTEAFVSFIKGEPNWIVVCVSCRTHTVHSQRFATASHWPAGWKWNQNVSGT